MRVLVCLLLVVSLSFCNIFAAEPESFEKSANGADAATEAKDATGSKPLRRLEFETALLADMQRPVGWQLDGETVENLAARVRRELKVPVVIEWQELEDAGVGREDSIAERLEGLPLEQALEVALRRWDLVWTLSGRKIVFTTPEGDDSNLETRVYPVGDLLIRGEFKQADFDSLIDAITSTVAAETWAENGGGEAEIRSFDSGGIRALIISQTFTVHRRIAQLLQDMREARDTDVEDAKSVSAMSFDEFRELLVPVETLDPDGIAAADNSSAADRDRLKMLSTTEGLCDVARRSNEFSLELLRYAASGDGQNFVLCGYSVREALAIVALGATGDTRRELFQTLRLPELTRDAATESLAMRFHLSSPDSSKGQFSSANCLWLQSGLSANAEFAALAEKAMDAGVRAVDFQRPNEASAAINEWISVRTHEKLKKVVSSTDIYQDTISAIVNATYFKGVWETPFEVSQTEQGEFTLGSGESIEVPMMHGEVFARTATLSDSGIQIAELPYRGERMSAVILLPAQQKSSLAELQKSLTAESLATWIEALDPVDLQLTMPRFKIQSKHELRPALEAMGLSQVFDLASADLRRIVDTPLAIDRVIQSALIEVDERGTEAAAATAMLGFGGIKSTPLETMVVDRPFLFLIRDVSSGALLFIASVTNPAE